MSLAVLDSLPKSRLKALLDHFGRIDDPRQPSQVAHPLPEVLLLVVCGTICDCALRSTDSADGCPPLFAGFVATMARSDFSRPCIIGYGSSPPMRTSRPC